MQLAARVAALVFAVAASVELAAQPQASPAHGLRGHYYTATLQSETADYKGVEYDDLWLPAANKLPDAERVDPQIAFGKDSGFVLDHGKQRDWYPVPKTAAVVWTGSIRFPAAGTYYLTTVSHNASAVYLNEARVSLSGGYGGVAPSENFVIEAPGMDRLANPDANSYAVPIELDAPRVLPITVVLSLRNASSTWGFGIDLYWTTPDSTLDAQGKRIARIVPSEALYPDAPQNTAPAVASAAASSLTADKLYFFLRMSQPVHVQVRLRDREGKPLAGRRVHLSTLADQGKAEAIPDPPPTDADGITTATVSPDPKGRGHVTRIFATATDDWVDVAQSAELSVIDATSGAAGFFSDLYSPYFDKRALQIVPDVPVAGSPAQFTVPLQNHLKYPVSIYVVLGTREFNIGLADWREIARSERVTLQPDESHVFHFTWTPEREASHQCFSAVVIGTIPQNGKARRDIPPFADRALARSTRELGPAHFVQAAWHPTEFYLAQRFCTHGTGDTSLCPGSVDDDLPWYLRSADPPDAPLAQTQRNLSVAGVGNWIKNKVNSKYGSVPLAPGVSLDPTKGKVTAGGGVDVSIRGRKVAGVDVRGSVGAEQSSDPHKILSASVDVSANVAGYHVTVASASGTVPAPAISRDTDPAVSTGPRFSELRALAGD